MLEMPIVPEEREERNFREGDFAIEVTKRIIRLRRALRYDVLNIIEVNAVSVQNVEAVPGEV